MPLVSSFFLLKYLIFMSLKREDAGESPPQLDSPLPERAARLCRFDGESAAVTLFKDIKIYFLLRSNKGELFFQK